LDLKKLYYYVICVMAFFVLMWGVVDLTSSSIGIFNLRSATPSLSLPAEEQQIVPEKGDQFFDTYYQSKMLNDRFWDSLARILISGLIFAYCRFTVNKLEKLS
ncbi:MAG: hypothetical protein KJ732_03380, partial [Candidatus Margulisbacteria bacterium]|nr:hypothetical protein [Candidatus Margulisiibacteriota bacterium]